MRELQQSNQTKTLSQGKLKKNNKSLVVIKLWKELNTSGSHSIRS